jgi:hypothetical protein
VNKNKIHIAISILLLTIMLVGRVGLHILHHHEFSKENKHLTGVSISAEESEAADCALCKLDTFQDIAIGSIAIFIFIITVVKPVYHFLLATVEQFSFFAKNRGPPARFTFIV